MKKASWTILNTGPASAKKNMERDARLLEGLIFPSASPVLHLYDWKTPSATYGHFIDPSKHLIENAVNYVELARRPTGGGLIFHTRDLAFSVLVPSWHEGYSVNTLDNYAFVNSLVIEVIGRFLGRSASMSLLETESQCTDKQVCHFCMAKPTKYDVMLDGKKVGGAAQRRTKSGFLHQGSISLAKPDEALLKKVLLPGTGVYESMMENSYALLPGNPSSKELHEARLQLQASFTAIFES